MHIKIICLIENFSSYVNCISKVYWAANTSQDKESSIQIPQIIAQLKIIITAHSPRACLFRVSTAPLSPPTRRTRTTRRRRWPVHSKKQSTDKSTKKHRVKQNQTRRKEQLRNQNRAHCKTTIWSNATIHNQTNKQQEKRLDLPTKQTLLIGGDVTELVWEQYKSALYHASKIWSE